MVEVGLIVTVIVLWGAAFLFRSWKKQQNLEHEQARRMRRLSEISNNPNLTLHQQLNCLLDAGRQTLNLDAAVAVQVDADLNVGEIISCHATKKALCRSGETLHLNNTLALETYEKDEMIQRRLNGEEAADTKHICNGKNICSFIGKPLHVSGQKYGVLCFYGYSSRHGKLSTLDLEFINLISAWVRVILERIIAQRSMEAARQTAEAANQAKSYFLANMSHEIRTPLTTIIGYSEALQEDGELDQDTHETLDIIIRSGKHLHEIINDILDLSKIEAGQLLIEKIATSPLEILRNVEHLISPLTAKKQVAFKTNIVYPLPRLIKSDPTRLQQILLNLCSNAAKFTSKGEVEVTIRYLEPISKLHFCVRDTGIGMTQDEMEKILKPFMQADSSISRKFGGSGLGLYIAQQLIEKLGGHLSFTSEKNVGSEFDFTIDVGPAEEIELISQNNKPHTADEPTTPPITVTDTDILVVEDNVDNCHLIKFYLDKLGARISFAHNGQQALDKVSEKSFDMVLMDTNMPVMDGITATKKLREQGFDKPIITITANALHKDSERSLHAGANDFLLKPIETKRFYEVITSHLNENNISQEEDTAQEPPTNDPRFKQLVNNFLEHLPEKLNQLDAASRLGDRALMQDISHNLKGLGGGYGFPNITDAARELNDQLKTNHFESTDSLVEKLKSVCQHAIANEN